MATKEQPSKEPIFKYWIDDLTNDNVIICNRSTVNELKKLDIQLSEIMYITKSE